MPGLVRKLIIYATAQGLLLQPLTSRNQCSNALPVQIQYGSHDLSLSLKRNEDDRSGNGLESHGILGLITFASNAYLISIARREQIAQVRGKAIFVITDVNFIPLSSQQDAQHCIDDARSSRAKKDSAGTDTEDDDTDASVSATDDEYDTNPVTPAVEHPRGTSAQRGIGALAKGTSVAADVIKDRGRYGRFAERWFSKAGWTANGRANQGMSNTAEDDLTREQKRQGLNALPDEESTTPEAAQKELQDAVEDKQDQGGEPDGVVEQVGTKAKETAAASIMTTLTPRILRTLRVWLSAHSFYFSYDYDLSRRLADQEHASSDLPLYKTFDSRYFWNYHLLEPLIASEQASFILPVMQGFVGQRAFTVGKTPKDQDDKILDFVEDPSEMIELWERVASRPTSPRVEATEPKSPKRDADDKDFLLTLISRRSVRRAGLRYLRRGVDDSGNVANNVETEQLLSSPTWNTEDKTFSLLQIRGSMPLFFSQSPYSFKPVPITYGSEATNHLAFNKHFANLVKAYGKIHAASLVDKHGTEKSIGELYQHHAEMTNEGKQPSHGFSGSTRASSDKKPPSSPCAQQDPRHIAFTWFDFHHECRAMNFGNISYLLDVLQKSLTEYGWTESVNSKLTAIQSGVIRTNCMDCLDRTNVVQSAIAGHVLTQQLNTFGLVIDLTSDPRTQWFNTLWADNGDAISRQYAGTAALKGDFTRTRKRHWTGALNDFSLTLGRYYTNIFSDYFLQTTIDYVLGLGDETLWEEFESELMTSDYALDMQRVRQEAVERCVRVVLGRGAEASDLEGVQEKHAADDAAGAETSVDENPDHQQISPQSSSPNDDPLSSPPASHDFEEEDLISGWTLHTPSQPNTLKSQPLEECVLLLTDAALYAVRFDWHTEKVGSYERVALSDITGIKRGVYITSTLGAKNLDEERNFGFVVTFHQRGGEGVRRVNTRSLQTDVGTAKKQDSTRANDLAQGVDGGTVDSSDTHKGDTAAQGLGLDVPQGEDANTQAQDFAPATPADAQRVLDEASSSEQQQPVAAQSTAADDGAKQPASRLLAFKSLSPRSTAVTHGSGSNNSGSAAKASAGKAKESMHEADVVTLVTDEIRRAAERLSKSSGGGGAGSSGSEAAADKVAIWEIRDEDVISLAEARKATGYFETIGYSLRRLVWS